MIQGRGTDQIRERNPSFYVTISSGSAIRRQETNHHHHVISRVSRIVSIYWFDCWFDPFVGRHPTPSTIEHASSRFLRSFERNLRDYTIESLFSLLPLYFSFGRTHYWSNDRNIEVGESKLNYHMTIRCCRAKRMNHGDRRLELNSRECRDRGGNRSPSTGQKLPCRAIVADSWNERKSPRLCFHARNVRFLLGVSIRSDKLEHDPSQY